MIGVIASIGLRVGEAISLTVRDVQETRRWYEIYREVKIGPYVGLKMSHASGIYTVFLNV
jgi:integrase